VEDGFLDGLDLSFRPGLNTLIGARGTGKTSIIELIRFCFGIPGYTAESTRKSKEHALSILGNGQVTLTVNDGVRSLSMSRAADGVSKSQARLQAPIVFFPKPKLKASDLSQEDASASSMHSSLRTTTKNKMQFQRTFGPSPHKCHLCVEKLMICKAHSFNCRSFERAWSSCAQQRKISVRSPPMLP